uniref:Peroxiredoxin-like 2A n=1 Tax=Cyanistes caeruleus TaxID=156563 RepID=A0A8C0UIA6_CYACU
GTEVEDFQHYFKGEIFLDEKKGFYGPRRRKMMLSGFFRLGVWQNFFRAWRSGYSGNLEGEGFTLGGVYVIGAGRQGVLLEHREKEFGDKVSLPSVLEAAEKIKTQTAGTLLSAYPKGMETEVMETEAGSYAVQHLECSFGV